MNVHSLLDTLETIKNMDAHVPRKPEKLAEKSEENKRKSSSKQDGNPCKTKKSTHRLYVINMAEPKQPTILGIVGNMIKMVLLRWLSRKPLLNPRNPTVSLIRRLQIIFRK